MDSRFDVGRTSELSKQRREGTPRCCPPEPSCPAILEASLLHVFLLTADAKSAWHVFLKPAHDLVVGSASTSAILNAKEAISDARRSGLLYHSKKWTIGVRPLPRNDIVAPAPDILALQLQGLSLVKNP